MLTIAATHLPQSPLTYLAFRISFLETLERIALARQFEAAVPEGFGFLTEVPFFHAVPPHIQLDLLAETWRRHLSAEKREATIADESVVYAVCETAARIVERDATFFFRIMRAGPVELNISPDHFLASEVRRLQDSLAGEGDFLMLSQFEDMPPETGRRLKSQFRMDEERLEPMFDILGRWHLQDDMLDNLTGLLSANEIRRVSRMLTFRQPAL